MNRQQWKLAISASLEPSGRLVSQSGKSGYDNLIVSAKMLVDAGDATELLEGILLVAKGGVEQAADWWLALMQFMDSYNFQVSSALRTRVINFVEGDPCNDHVARGYLLRIFADLGLPLNWNRLANQGFYQSLLDSQPLLLADALVRSNENQRASAAIVKARSMQGVQEYHIQQMFDRWHDAGFTYFSNTSNPIQIEELLRDFSPVSFTAFTPLALAA